MGVQVGDGVGRDGGFFPEEYNAALAGWEPPGTISPCELVEGESSPIEKGVSIYVQTWETARFLTGA